MSDERLQALLAHGSRQAYLSVSALVRTYCKYHSDCDDSQAVTRVVNTLLEDIGYNCRANSPAEKEKVTGAINMLTSVNCISQKSLLGNFSPHRTSVVCDW